MADPNLGNKSDELGQFHERPLDFAELNHGQIVPSGQEVPHKIERHPHGILVSKVEPENVRPPEIQNVEQVAMRITEADVFDDPGMTGQHVTDPDAFISALLQNLANLALVSSRRISQRNRLQFYQVGTRDKMAAFGERIVVEQDTVNSHLCCPKCEGKGHSDQQCRNCEGSCVSGGKPCNECVVAGYDERTDVKEKRSCGFTQCSDCRGWGWRGGLVLPKAHQMSPVSGVVVSVGPRCIDLMLGDRVIFSRYAGQVQTTDQGTFITMLEHEVTNLLERSEPKTARESL